MSQRPAEEPAVLDEPIVRAIGAALVPAELSAHGRAALRERVMKIANDAPPENTETIRGDSLQWHKVFPNVWAKVLKRDVPNNLQIMLFRMEPGGIVPAHAHTLDEECLVLEGEVLVGSHPVRKGDMHIARAGARHPNLWTRTGALVMVRSEIPPLHIE
jgi:quercetin dioxygenase-like cupin family protein